MLRDEIVERLARMGLTPNSAQLAMLVRHAEMLAEANSTLNLTRLTSDQDVALLHVADSLTALPSLAAAPPGPFADLGSGGGYPGIPLGVMSGRHATLVEARKKKAAFLLAVIDAIRLDADVKAMRAEELAESEPGSFSAVVARALAPLPSLVELASPLLRRGGLLVAMKGRPSDDELAAGDRAAELAGMRRASTTSVQLPGDDSGRVVVTYAKTAKPRIRLPRRLGMAQHSPLA